MDSHNPSARDRLLEALAMSDQNQRAKRADRIIWLSEVQFQPPLMMGPIDTLTVLEEARVCFVNGQFVGAQLLAAAFIEQALVDALVEKGLAKPGIKFQDAVRLAGEASLFESALVSRVEIVRKLRNPFTHRKADGHPDTFGARFRSKKQHPDLVLEADARLAMEAMYGVLRAVARWQVGL